jgi:hypothetical protein
MPQGNEYIWKAVTAQGTINYKLFYVFSENTLG